MVKRQINQIGGIKGTKPTGIMLMLLAVLAALLVAGCTSSPEKTTSNQTQNNVSEAPTTVKYIELNLVDNSKVGGKYVSESAAFVTIIPLYVLDKNGFMTKGNEKEVGIKTSAITIITNITDPTPYMAATLKAQEEKATELEAARQKAAEEEEKQIEADKLRREAELAKRMPTGKNRN